MSTLQKDWTFGRNCYFKHGFPDHWRNNKKEINSYLKKKDSEKIVIDSGATNHVTNNKTLLENTMNVKKCFNRVNVTNIYTTLVGDINLKIEENVLSLKKYTFVLQSQAHMCQWEN
jgi:hypothetical protein